MQTIDDLIAKLKYRRDRADMLLKKGDFRFNKQEALVAESIDFGDAIRYAEELKASMDDGWVSVKTRLPESGQKVIATNGKDTQLLSYTKTDSNNWFVGAFAGDGGSMFNPEPYTRYEYLHDVTHWRLPRCPS